jgi:NAD(P)H-nitrite reductase large subunit
MPVRVDRCICFKRSFDELYAIAKKTGVSTLEDLQLETEFGMSCRICNPYVRRMLQTGQTVFHEILDEPIAHAPPAPPPPKP